MEDYLINMAVGTLLIVIKNPQKRAKLKSALLKIRDAINLAFASDPTFFPPETK